MKTATLVCMLLASLSLGISTAAAAADGCVPMAQFEAAHGSKFTTDEQVTEDAFRLTFHYTDATGTRSGSDNFPANTPEGIVAGSTVMCGEQVIVDNAAAERGGILFIGRLHVNGITLSSHYYASGDEDTAELDYRDGVLLVTTSTDGTMRLLEDADPGSELRHAFTPETLHCRRDDDGFVQELSLQINTAGQPAAINYSAMLSGTPQTSGRCDIDANSVYSTGDNQNQWEPVDANTVDIRWDDANEHSDDPQPSQLRIQRQGTQYTVDLSDMNGSSFCGGSWFLPRTLTLARGQTTCPAVSWPK